MKSTVKSVLVFVFILAATSMQAQEIIIPFSGKQYRSDKEYFRANASGKSKDLTLAKSIAMSNAKKEIAGLVESTVISASKQYTIQVEIEDKTEFGRKFEESVNVTINKILTNITVMDEKAFRDGDAITYYVALEIPKTEFVEKLKQNITKESLDLDQAKFEKFLDEEMSKFESEDE